MTKLTDTLRILLLVIMWSIFVVKLVQSDGICRGVCEGCVYSGWCPQERK